MYALEGLKIVDFGDWLAGPFAGRLMGDLGASVIKVEPPGGLSMRPRNDAFGAHRTVNYIVRGMRDMVIDLKQLEGQAIAHKLIAAADVVAQNMRVGVAERLGIGYHDVERINPRAIYVFSPGFGAAGPRAHLPSFEPLNSAFVGIHYRSGGAGNPPAQSISLDAYCGLLAACGTMMALLHRQKTGEGQYLDVSQLACAMYYTSETYKTADGRLGPLPQLDSQQMGLGALNRLYRTRNDWLCICCEQDAEWEALCEALGHPELRDDARFRTPQDRAEHAEALAALLEETLLHRTSQEWFALLERHRIPSEIPLPDGRHQALSNPAYDASGLVAAYPHPLWGMIREIGLAMHLSETPGTVRWPAPRFGEHTEEILAELGYSDVHIQELLRRGVVASASAAHGGGHEL
jgi:crotonobetainyl-CoA:carnitine CoA-transferase CaiB-like acyl-CoA transferase